MNLTGVLAPLPTPFADDDRLDVVRLRTAVEWWWPVPDRVHRAGFKR
jgi:dihydrodipicolinate synthase/N-acetylneuraminate lyase